MHRYALFGHPIAHTLSPTIHLQFAKQTHQILEYQAIDVQPDQFEATVMEFFRLVVWVLMSRCLIKKEL